MITKEQFTKMNKMRRRVALAKDVLEQLAAQMLISRRGSYVIPNHYQFLTFSEKHDKAFFQKFLNEKPCHVCAKGALVCSYVRNLDNYSYYSVIDSPSDGVNKNSDLIKVFGDRLWKAIEIFFEGWGNPACRGRVNFDSIVLSEEINPDGRRYEMAELMNNIVKNKGKLVINGLTIE